ITAVVCDVSLEEFTGAAGEAHLKDIAWLTPRALRHEQVVEHVGQITAEYPARFGTIFSSQESLERVIEQHLDSIRSFLDRTANTEEWGLKGFLDRESAREKLVDSELAAQSSHLSKSAGMRYMQERRIRADAEHRLSGWLIETASRIREELST